MLYSSGYISSNIIHPYIYFVIKACYLYIGETQRHPVIRWGAHLLEKGTFNVALKNIDREIWKKNEQISFCCVTCDELVNEIPEIERKLVTQYLEHQVHVRCIENLVQLKPIEHVISNTRNTAPTFCRYDKWCKKFSEKIFDQFSYYINKFFNS